VTGSTEWVAQSKHESEPGRTGRLPRWLHRWTARHKPGNVENCTAALSASEFLRLSGDLTALHDGAVDLSLTTRNQVAAVRSVLGDCRLTGAGGMADLCLGELQNGLANADRRAGALHRSGEAMRRLRGYGREMQRLASLLQFSGYGFAVESARSAASQQAFDAFIAELRKLAARVAVLGGIIVDRSDLARIECEHLIQVVRSALAELREVTAQAEQTVLCTSERAERALDLSSNALQTAQRHSDRIAAYAGDAVYHLQFGDIIRQKLEHVEAALSEAVPDSREQPLSIQAGQLDMAAQEISSARQRLQQAFAGLADEARALLATVTEFATSDHRADPVEELRSAFLRIEELRQRGTGVCHQASDTMARASETADQLSRHVAEVEEVNLEIHLQALNAIVKTSLLGDDGRTLEILSMYVQRIFEESDELVKETVSVITYISDIAAGCNTATEGAREPAPSRDEELCRLASFRNEFRDAMQSAVAQVTEQESRLEQARESLKFLSELEEDITALSHRIEDLQASSSHGRPTPPHGDGILSQRYTIASEREVHRRVIGANRTESVPAEDHDLAAGDDTMGDNVELF